MGFYERTELRRCADARSALRDLGRKYLLIAVPFAKDLPEEAVRRSSGEALVLPDGHQRGFDLASMLGLLSEPTEPDEIWLSGAYYHAPLEAGRRLQGARGEV